MRKCETQDDSILLIIQDSVSVSQGIRQGTNMPQRMYTGMHPASRQLFMYKHKHNISHSKVCESLCG